ncbi:Ig domain-containing protein [Gemmatimonas sp.]|uniref:Ig-like domain-containing protein n=1 Tax=Gemmatimonas sp. TaxID=1962908 RepID=UPI003569A1AD
MTALQRMRTASGRLIATVLLSVLACGEPTVSDRTIDAVEVTPASPTVRSGTTVALSARARDAGGSTVPVSPFAWSSSNASVATVSATGLVTAAAPGTARIAVSARGISATTTVTVTERLVASIAMTPAISAVRVGGTVLIRAQPLDADNVALVGRAIAWSSSDPTVARVDANGTVTGVAPGAVTIVATSQGRFAQAAVTVTLPPIQTVTLSPGQDTLAVGTDRQFSATLRDANGVVLLGRSVSWSSSNVTVAIVTATGNVLALQPGTATISAASEGRVGTARVVVPARLAGTVALSPSVSTLTAGSTLTLQAQITDNDGNVLTNRPLTFASDAPTVASVSTAGVVTALAPGNARITATSEGKTGVASVQVVPVPVASLDVTPSATNLFVGDARQFTVMARAANGAVLTGRSMLWRSGASGVISVSAEGVVAAIAPGIALVVVESEGISATSAVTVSVPTVASIVVSPPNPALRVNESVQLAAIVRDAAGVPLSDRALSWRSSAENVVFVSSTGLVVGVGIGSAIITVTSEGISASVTITVR